MDETFLPARASHQMVFAMWRWTYFNAAERAEYLESCRKVFVQQKMIMGTFFGGDRVAISDCCNYFWDLHDMWPLRGRFVGVNQCLITAYFCSDRESLIQQNYLADGQVYNQWFATWGMYGSSNKVF
jgi:hypothetical protein